MFYANCNNPIVQEIFIHVEKEKVSSSYVLCHAYQLWIKVTSSNRGIEIKLVMFYYLVYYCTLSYTKKTIFMKNTLLLCILICVSAQIDAQITIEKFNYTAEASDSIFRVSVDPNSVTTPVAGTDKIWDYTTLDILGQDTVILDAYSGTNYPAANITKESQGLFSKGILTFIRTTTHYETLNDTEHSIAGISHSGINLPVGDLTGTASDTLYMLEHDVALEAPKLEVWFPLNYQDEQTANYVDDDLYLATIAAFGLDKLESSVQSKGLVISEIVGWGSLMLTNPVDQTIVTLETLLMEETIVEQDSFFTGGQATPPQLIGAMQVEQGQQSFTTIYKFYAKGFPDAVLTISNTEAWMLADLTPVISAVEVVEKNISLDYYPNPVTDEFHLQFEKTTNEPWMYSIYNAMGQKVFQQLMHHPKGMAHESFSFKNQIDTGYYFFDLRDAKGTIMANGSMLKR